MKTSLEAERQKKLTSQQATHGTRVTESKIRVTRFTCTVLFATPSSSEQLFLASQLQEVKTEERFKEQVRREKWTMCEHVRGWDSTRDLIQESDHILTEKRVKLDNPANVDRDVVEEEFLKEELSPSTPLLPKPFLSPLIPAPPQMGQSNEGPGNKEDSESSVSVGAHKGDSDEIPATKKEVLVTLDWDSVDGLFRESSRKDEDSETCVSIKKYLEEFNATLKEEFENKVWTYGDHIEDLPRKEILLPPPPPSRLLHPLPPNVSSALPEFSVDSAVPVGPPIPTFLPPAPAVPPLPSIEEIMEEVDQILAKNFSNVFPTDRNVKEEFLPGNLLLLPPPPCPPVWLGPPQLHTDTLILHSLPIIHVPEDFKLQPVGVLNGEILYHAVQTPLNVNTSKRVRVKPDDGRPYVKKPPNAFMIFLKELRPQVVSELNTNRSDMVNKVVGEKWNSLPVEVKAKYFEKARLEQKLHQQQHPGWSTNDNYGKKKWAKNKMSSSSSNSSSSSCSSNSNSCSSNSTAAAAAATAAAAAATATAAAAATATAAAAAPAAAAAAPAAIQPTLHFSA
ncbi:transcription factor 7-like 1-A [Poeciliopsis prolifica]|uniref:transcription factor 7-like 1-A n=1 Tax=Poeciliopsis prolifica TaxID=188132 RepID=UPI0024131621|nr:transcription factor 7-like 1-A [Poeciliopsis prolifica]